MPRSRDLFKHDRLAARDFVQVWVLSLLLNILPVTAILLLDPSVGTLMEGLRGMGVAFAVIVGLDLVLLLLAVIWLLLNHSKTL